MGKIKTYLIETTCGEYLIRTDATINMLNGNIKRRTEKTLDCNTLGELIKLPFQKRVDRIKGILNGNF